MVVQIFQTLNKVQKYVSNNRGMLRIEVNQVYIIYTVSSETIWDN